MEFIRPIWEGITELIGVALDVITTVVTLAVRGILALWENHGERIMSTVVQVFTTIRDVIVGVMDVISGILNVVMGVLTGDWSRAWEGVQKIVGGVWDAITALIRGA
ncbi:hypothetical protein LCGC14_3105340, partial [marine sediment metagenome]